MPTTSNFGWTTPADTDLVKDGAAAIRTLGNGIDSSLVDLKGGTTGQNLRKATNTDLDFTWAGDATNTVIDAEGDLLVGDSADTLQRLTIGTTGQVLTVDTAIDGKVKWAAVASGGMTSLASGTLSTGTGTLTLSGISADYKNLQLVVRDCYGAAGAGGILTIQVNSVTDYDLQVISTDNTNVAGYFAAGVSRHRCYYNGVATTNDENTLVVDFYDYSDTTSSKLIVSRMHYNSTLPLSGEIAIVTGFANTTAAISSITLALNSGNFGAAGTYVLYGVK